MSVSKTSAQAISRKLKALNFPKLDQYSETGFLVYEQEKSQGWDTEIVVDNYCHDNGYPTTIAQELIAAGYEIDIVIDQVKNHKGFILTSVTVLGKVGA